MTREEQVQFCRVCLNRKFDPALGLICALTLKRADFQSSCSNYSVDYAEKALVEQKELALQQMGETGGFLGPEKKAMKKGVLGGIVMIVIAVVWFFGGLAVNRIFFYPPVLAIIGIVSVVKGASEGNLAGK